MLDEMTYSLEPHRQLQGCEILTFVIMTLIHSDHLDQEFRARVCRGEQSVGS